VRDQQWCRIQDKLPKSPIASKTSKLPGQIGSINQNAA
jgi:hypothetical protein